MKISIEEVSRILQTQGVARKSGSGANGNGKTASVNSIAPAASVEVSAAANEIQRVKKLVDQTPDIREDIVQSIKARIESGTYKVSSEDVADLMLRRAQADRIR